MSSKASVEIWEIILKYAIDVPLFLDPNPLRSYDIDILDRYSYQSPYWQAERVRNSLRRVCSAWDVFLRIYNHRFIRMDDVLRKQVQIDAIPSAIRIDFNRHCRCQKCNYISFRNEYMERMVDMWTTAVWGRPGQSKKTVWKLEILDGWLNPRSEYVTTLKRLAPKLRVMLAQPTSTLTLKEDALPNLAILRMDIDPPRRSVNTVGLTSITVLQITLTALGFPLDKDGLVSLKHLTIVVSPRGTGWPTQQDLCAFLHGVGPQLETFYYRHWLMSWKIDEDVWNVLPEVKRIQLPYAWNDCELPPYHPLQQIQISNAESRRCGTLKDPEPGVKRFLPSSSSRPWKVRLSTTWAEEVSANSKFIVWMIEYCEENGTEITDSHGETFAGYIVFLIEAFWKQPGRRYRLPARNGECPQKLHKREMRRKARRALRTNIDNAPLDLGRPRAC